MTTLHIDFLSVEDVLFLHERQLARYGGATGVRDRNLLESAVAQAQMSFAGNYIHPTLFSMASAYLFHLVRNHPFVDGNKRCALLSALVFLDTNGICIEHSSQELYQLTMAAAEGKLSKEEITRILEELASRYPTTKPVG